MSGEKRNIGYHLENIPKGEYGDISKVKEEVYEFIDARHQNIRIMEMMELSDIYGALEAVAIKYNLTMDDLKSMSDCTKRAFISGGRK